VSDEVVYEQFDNADGDDGGGDGTSVVVHATDDWQADLRRLSDVPLQLSVEIGRTEMTVGETLDLRTGSIVTLDRLAGEPVDLLVNGTPIARGEVIVVDEQFGLRVTGIVEDEAGSVNGDDGSTPAARGTQTMDAGQMEEQTRTALDSDEPQEQA
jgi:flagellar motor switch protein FliN/FliY